MCAPNRCDLCWRAEAKANFKQLFQRWLRDVQCATQVIKELTNDEIQQVRASLDAQVRFAASSVGIVICVAYLTLCFVF
jgi:hypothetical protein